MASVSLSSSSAARKTLLRQDGVRRGVIGVQSAGCSFDPPARGASICRLPEVDVHQLVPHLGSLISTGIGAWSACGGGIFHHGAVG